MIHQRENLPSERNIRPFSPWRDILLQKMFRETDGVKLKPHLGLQSASLRWSSHGYGRLIFIHHQCWEVLPFCRFQRQRCIKIRVLRAQDFYTPLALKTAKGQHLPALVVYKNQSPRVGLHLEGYSQGWGVGVYTMCPLDPLRTKLQQFALAFKEKLRKAMEKPPKFKKHGERRKGKETKKGEV